MIVGASDRMITSGLVEYEPPQRKVGNLTPHIVALVAGDYLDQAAILRATLADLTAMSDPTVKEVAEVYAGHFAALRSSKAERTVLAPLGLTLAEFIIRSKDLSPELSRDLSGALRRQQLDAEAIIAGVEPSDVDGRPAAHIYVVRDPGFAECADAIGFATIGIGDEHASSQFMAEGFISSWSFARALFMAYAAKKRAEVAPGVGQATDMMFIGPHPALFVAVDSTTEGQLRAIYDQFRDRQKSNTLTALASMDEYVQGLKDAYEAGQKAGQIHNNTGQTSS